MNLAIAISRSNKSIVSLIILITIALNSFPQIAFEKNVNTILKTFQLENGSIKYFELNKKTKAISIYNMDNSLWKTINLEIPKNHYLGEIKLISQKTFNDDDLMEVRSEEHTSELQSHSFISYAVFCLKKKKK